MKILRLYNVSIHRIFHQNKINLLERIKFNSQSLRVSESHSFFAYLFQLLCIEKTLGSEEGGKGVIMGHTEIKRLKNINSIISTYN